MIGVTACFVARAAIHVAEFGSELICVGVAGAQADAEGKAEVVEDVQGPLPGVAGRVEIAGGAVCVAEVVEVVACVWRSPTSR